EIVSGVSGDFLQKARENDLKGIKGIGDALAQKINELATTGKLEYYEDLRGEFPDSIFELFEISGLGSKKVKALYEQLGVVSIADLKSACESGKVAALPGFAKKSTEKILEAIAFREQNATRFRLGDVHAVAETILESLRQHPDAGLVSPAGSFRRGKETLHDLDFIVSTNHPGAVMDFFIEQPWVENVIVHGQTKSSVHLEKGLQCDLRAVAPDEYPFALNYFTGSKEHNVAIRGRARSQGFTLNEYRLAPLEEGGAEAPPIQSEEDLYKALGLVYIEPALRENGGEIEAAEKDELPRLLERENLRGTFHNHTRASDGSNSLEEMAAAAQELGLEYLGIADHSKSSVQANGLKEDRLLAQVEEIKKLNRSLKKEGFRLFTGTECDILSGGKLDFEDDVLSQLDYVVASVHNQFQLSEKDQTKRIIKAMENPHITMIGHLTGRLLLKREPYPVDVPAIIEAAAETGTWIELNANPWRLDMDWRWWKLARDKGVLCSINPDAHTTNGLQHLHFGIEVARKGWLTREDVANCRPLSEIEDLLSRKRQNA
ncbi:MAG: DNA polymerase/3'-5' exonuclease PolX, partial [Verrucomicrobiota bacterium]